MEQISLDALISFHKQEGQEALTYLTILFTVIIGIIGYLGTAQKVEKSARILILLFYVGLHSVMVMSFLDSMEMHSALHQEISNYVIENPQEFLKGDDSPLYNALKGLHAHPVDQMRIAGVVLLLFVILCILSVGDNRILKWTWLNRAFASKN